MLCHDHRLRGHLNAQSHRRMASHRAPIPSKNFSHPSSSRTSSKSSRPPAPVQVNKQYTVFIDDLSHEGYGVGKIDNFPIFIPNALPSEQVTIKVTATKQTYAHATTIKTLTPSPDRTIPECKYFGRCGGCQLQHLSYVGQLSYKENMVRNIIQRIGKLNQHVIIRPIIGMTDTNQIMDEPIKSKKTVPDNNQEPSIQPWRYRNKAQIPCGASSTTGKGLSMGFYEPRSHTIINTKDCLISSPQTSIILSQLRTFLENECELEGYNETSHTGDLRHIIVRDSSITNEIMLIFVTRTDYFPYKDKIINYISSSLFKNPGMPKIASIYQNINSQRTNTILGQHNNLLWGKSTIRDQIGDTKFNLSPLSFFQVNPTQTLKLYQIAREYAALKPTDVMIDAYCGIGTIGLFFAPHCRAVLGVEIVADAILDAKSNAKLNSLKNCYFETGAAEEVIPRWYTEKNVRADVIVVDPPRKGCDKQLLDTIIQHKIRRVVYVSCNPATLARDLQVLETGGFTTKEITPVDMFPHTYHVECVALLEYDPQH